MAHLRSRPKSYVLRHIFVPVNNKRSLTRIILDIGNKFLSLSIENHNKSSRATYHKIEFCWMPRNTINYVLISFTQRRVMPRINNSFKLHTLTLPKSYCSIKRNRAYQVMITCTIPDVKYCFCMPCFNLEFRFLGF